jgi:hypothetical protein
MDKLKKFNNVRYDFLIESVNSLDESRLELVMESFNIGEYQRATKKLMGEIGFNLYSVGTYGVSVAALYPVIQKLMETGKFDLSPSVQNVVLLTICAISVLVRENKDKVKELVSFASKKGMTPEDLDKAVNQIKTTKGIFAEIAHNFGKVISTFTDMLAYTSLLVPFSMVLGSLISQGRIDSEQMSQTLPALELSMGSMGFKVLLNRIMHKLEVIIRGTDKFQNVENIKPLLVNDEFKSPELRPSKVQIVNKSE